MKAASILLALIVVLGFVSEVGAAGPRTTCDLSFFVGDQRIGLADWEPGTWVPLPPPWTILYLGPLGSYRIPFTATQGLVGFCLILVAFIAMLVALSVRWKKKRAAA
jgi:hypothetical protein